MSLLITGANGFVGKYLCVELLSQGISVRAATRSANIWVENEKIEASTVGEIDGLTNWDSVFDGVDAIVHLAARVHISNDKALNPLAAFRRVNVDGTLNLAKQASAAGVRRFVFISSIGVNGNENENERRFTEEDKPNPQEPYAMSKLEAEQGLRVLAQKTGMEVVIIRPPLVYGANASGNFANMLGLIKWAVRFHFPLPFGAIYNRRSLVAVQNLVNFIVVCINHPAAANQTFLVADGVDISTTELFRACAVAQGVSLFLLKIPQRWLVLAATLLGKQAMVLKLCGNLQVDVTKAQNLLDWVPPVSSVAEGLKLSARDMT